MVPGFEQAKICDTTGVSGLVVFEQLLNVRTHLWVSNGIAQVLPNQPLWLFLPNLSNAPRCLPQNMEVETASGSLLDIWEVTEKMGQAFERFLHVEEDAVESADVTEKRKGQIKRENGRFT